MAEAEGNAVLRRLGARLQAARDALGLKQEFVAGKVGVKQASISRIEAGKVAPGEDLLEALADLYKLPVEELRFELAPAMIERIPEPYRPFIQVSRAAESGKAGTSFPIYGLASCGALVEAIRDERLPTGDVRLSESWPAGAKAARSRQAFIVIAEGDSMEPTIAAGDELLVDPKTKPNNNDIALVQFRGETTVKRWQVVEGTILLTPDNPDRKRFPEQRIKKSAFETGTAWRVVRARRVLDRAL